MLQSSKGTRRRTYCRITSTHTGTPGLTHETLDVQEVNGWAWCPKCAIKWQNDVEQYIFPDTAVGRTAQGTMQNDIKDWVQWLLNNVGANTIKDWTYRAR